MILEAYPRDISIRLSYRLNSNEFQCKCRHFNCNFTLFGQSLRESWTIVRAKFGKPLKINSGHRCQKHNSDVGGEDNSFHMKGLAVDISTEKLEPLEVTLLETLCRESFHMVIPYGNFIHCHNLE